MRTSDNANPSINPAPQLPAPVDHQCEKRTGDPHDRHENRNRFQRVCDGERAVKNANRFSAKVAIRKQQHPLTGSSLLDFVPNGIQICFRRNVNRQIGRRGIRQIAKQRLAVH